MFDYQQVLYPGIDENDLHEIKRQHRIFRSVACFTLVMFVIDFIICVKIMHSLHPDKWEDLRHESDEFRMRTLQTTRAFENTAMQVVAHFYDKSYESTYSKATKEREKFKLSHEAHVRKGTGFVNKTTGVSGNKDCVDYFVNGFLTHLTNSDGYTDEYNSDGRIHFDSEGRMVTSVELYEALLSAMSLDTFGESIPFWEGLHGLLKGPAVIDGRAVGSMLQISSGCVQGSRMLSGAICTLRDWFMNTAEGSSYVLDVRQKVKPKMLYAWYHYFVLLETITSMAMKDALLHVEIMKHTSHEALENLLQFLDLSVDTDAWASQKVFMVFSAASDVAKNRMSTKDREPNRRKSLTFNILSAVESEEKLQGHSGNINLGIQLA